MDARDRDPTPSEADSHQPLRVRLQRSRVEQSLFGSSVAITIGRYTLRDTLGIGGMGVVYGAHDASLDREVALKVLGDHYADHPDASARMVREARAMARLSHPNVLTVHEVGVEDGQPFIAMELMPGGTLRDWMNEHPPDEPGRDDATIALLRQCAEGLLAAHEAGLVHRDFKPHNVLLTASGVAKVADFGLVRLPGETSEPDTTSHDAFARLDDGRTLTTTSGAPGTPRYMAPEQAKGIADARSDQYSLCTTFLEVFEGSSPPKEIVELLQRGASESADQRFEDLRALLARLNTLSTPPRPAARIAAATVASLAMLGAGAFAVFGDAFEPPPPPVTCDGGRELLEPIWGEARQAEIRAAFERSGSASWRNAWAGVQPRLDAWAETWVEARVDACEATTIRQVQDERMMTMRLACLDQRRSGVEILLEAYASADLDVVEDALTTSHALPSVASCADRAQLEYGLEGRGLDDPEVRAAYDVIGEADVLRLLGQDAEANARYEAITPELQRLELPSLLSHAAVQRSGLVLRMTGDYEQAALLAREALDHAERSDRDSDVLTAWLRMSEVARLRSRMEDAELYLQRAENIVARWPDALAMQAQVAHARGSFEGSQGHAKEALAALDRARDLLEEVDGSLINGIAIESDALGMLSILGRDEQALQRGEALVELTRRYYGPDHPLSILVSGSHARIFVRRGDWAKAAELTRLAVDRPMDSARADLLLDLRLQHAIAQQGLGHVDVAREIATATIVEALPILGPRHKKVLAARVQVAVLLIETGHHAEGLEQLQAMEESVEALHPMNRCGFWANMSLAHSGIGQHDEAVTTMDRALEICRARAAPGSIWMFTTLRYAGEVYEQAGKRLEALASYEEAIGIAAEITVAPPELAFVEGGLARLQRATSPAPP